MYRPCALFRRCVLSSLTIACALQASACSPSSNLDDSADDDTDNDADNDADNDNDNDNGDECVLPSEGELPNLTVPLEIHNASATTQFVIPYSPISCNYHNVTIVVGDKVVNWDRPSAYPYSCTGELCAWGCSDGGATGYAIAPGASVTIDWNGAYWARTPLSEACGEALACDSFPVTDCEIRMVPGDDQSYTARIYVTDECPDDQECEECTALVCDPFVYEPGPGMAKRTIEATAVWPDGVTLTIED